MAEKNTVAKSKASKKVNYSTMSASDLDTTINTLRTEAHELKRGTIAGDVQNVRAYGQKRKELARALTARRATSTEDK